MHAHVLTSGAQAALSLCSSGARRFWGGRASEDLCRRKWQASVALAQCGVVHMVVQAYLTITDAFMYGRVCEHL